MTETRGQAVRRLSQKWWRVVFPGCVALGMAAFMSGAITAVNTGTAPGFFSRWTHAFLIAFPLAWMAAIVWAPVAAKIAARFVVPPGGSAP